jgi:acylphosphatase
MVRINRSVDALRTEFLKILPVLLSSLHSLLFPFPPLAAAPPGETAGKQVEVDEKKKTVRVETVVAKQGTYEVLQGAIEYVLVGKGGKEYETLFVAAAGLEEVNEVFIRLGSKPGQPGRDGRPPKGMAFRIFAEYEEKGKTVRRPVDEFILEKKSGKPLEAASWIYTGSVKAFDPAANREALQFTITKCLVGLHHTDASPLFQNPRPEARDENLYKAHLEILPPAGTSAQLVFELVPPKIPAGTRRVHVFISGRVQGVGFRAFTQREASRLKLVGFVINLDDGRVEAVLEGPGGDVDKAMEKIRRGPRGARVEKVEVKEEAPDGLLEDFQVRYEKEEKGEK